MAAVPAPDRNPAGYTGLRESVSALAGHAAGYFRARLRLLQLEAGEAFGSWFKLAICVVAALLFLAIGYCGLVVGLIVWAIVAGFSPPGAIFIAAAIHVALALILLLIGKARFAKPGFQQTFEELHRDQEWLTPPARPDASRK